MVKDYVKLDQLSQAKYHKNYAELSADQQAEMDAAASGYGDTSSDSADVGPKKPASGTAAANILGFFGQ